MSGAVEQQRIEELCAASIRALSGLSDVHFRGHNLYRGSARIPLHAPHQRLDDDGGIDAHRGVGDGVALKLGFSSAALHARMRPSDPVARLVFEMLEQFRVESLAPANMVGVRENLEQRFGRWSDDFVESGLADTDLGLLLFAVAQICRARIHGAQVPERFEDMLEPTRAGLAPVLGHDFAGIRRERHDQAAFAAHALAIAGIIADSVAHAESERPATRSRTDERRALFTLSLDFDEEQGEGFASAPSGNSRTLDESDGGYRVFTRAYDREVSITELVREQQLAVLRERLDRRVRRHGINVPRLARLFKAMLSVPARDGFSFGEESGHVDGRRLSQLISSPTERRLFTRERQQPQADCRFTMLIDCSGSMKQYIEPLACLVDIMLRALEQAGVETELLGFTTNAWSGGRAQRDWIRQGRPPMPGRLNESSHMVFKDAATSWRRARRRIAGLLRPDLFREGIDGEAVNWACSRSMSADVGRRILMVISDGSPMDTATALANDPFYLDNHLKQVVERWSTMGGVDIMGLGVGLDLSAYYDRCLAVDLAHGISMTLFLDILEVLRGHHRR